LRQPSFFATCTRGSAI